MFDIWLNSTQKKALTELFFLLGKIPTGATERHMFFRSISWRFMDFWPQYLLLLVMIAITNLTHSCSGWDQLVEAESGFDHLVMW